MFCFKSEKTRIINDHHEELTHYFNDVDHEHFLISREDHITLIYVDLLDLGVELSIIPVRQSKLPK